MKLTIYIILTAVLFPFISMGQHYTYQINGTIKGLGNDTLILGIMHNRESKPVLVKIAGRQDQLSFKGEATGTPMVFAQLDRKLRSGNFVFFLEPGTITINGSVNDINKIQATGTPVNDDFSVKNRILNSFYDRRETAYKAFNSIEDKQSKAAKDLMYTIGVIADSLQAYQISTVKKDPTSYFSAIQVGLLADQVSVFELEQLYNTLGAPAKSLFLLKDIPDRIKAKKASQIGSKAATFKMKDMNGKEVDLASFKGKYVLLDFWASWCVPCRKKNPGLIAVNNKFKGSPFQIIGVSLDDKDDSWRKAIAEDKLDWIHLRDGLNVKNGIASMYGVQPIPENFLINPEGIIIAIGIFDNELDAKLSGIFNKK